MISTSTQNDDRSILSNEKDPLIWSAPIQIQNNNIPIPIKPNSIHNNGNTSHISTDVVTTHNNINTDSQPNEADHSLHPDNNISQTDIPIGSYPENSSSSYILRNENEPIASSHYIPTTSSKTFENRVSSSFNSPLRNTVLYPKEENMPEINTKYIEKEEHVNINNKTNSTHYYKDHQNFQNKSKSMSQVNIDHQNFHSNSNSMSQVNLDHQNFHNNSNPTPQAHIATNELSSKHSDGNSTKIDGITKTKPLLNIAEFPTEDLLKMLTSLLERIVNSNDEINATTLSHPSSMENNNEDEDIRYSVSCFYGKHIPQISIERYLLRIQKHCSTTNDIYLSLLVYFDRISKKCNNKPNDPHSTPGDDDDGDDDRQHFVMDSYNIHRLLISAVAVSTKFFSDYFYSNARYARVGGISLQEMNKLEIQFMVLCDFKLLIPVEELQRYADLLYTFWTTHNEQQDPVDPN